MSTKYEEMRQAAINASQNWEAYRQRCVNYMGMFLDGFLRHCGIPENQITYLRWNGATDERRTYTLQGAMVFDESNGYWHLGISLDLTSMRFVMFLLCVTEENTKPVFRFGGKSRSLDFNDPSQTYPMYEEIVETIKRSFCERRSSESRRIGFS